MPESASEIVIVERRLAASELARLVRLFFGDMVINIRPSQGNRSMEIVDSSVRDRIREITFELIGRGEPLE
jgi:hypothetical protein